MSDIHETSTIASMGQTALPKLVRQALGLLERDIRAGINVRTLPEDLAKSMLVYSEKKVDHDEAIEGDVAI
jgi:bifunctional DNA-binding transcriptional regulator/antitoxin component of YhaV-PrlF toxin-antitoxin module